MLRVGVYHSAICLVIWILLTDIVCSIDIKLTYDDPILSIRRDQQYEEKRDHLIRIMKAAKEWWEDILEDPWTIDISFQWADFPHPAHQAETTVYRVEQNRPKSAVIKFRYEHDWYFDRTPLDNFEFDMQRRTFRDIHVSFKKYFSGSIPLNLECWYEGKRLPTSPEIHWTLELGQYDLFTVALHELGHALGLDRRIVQNEILDGDYDYNPAFIGGATASLLPVKEGYDFDNRMVHFFSQSDGNAVRTLPSAMEILALASAVGWKQVDLPRKAYLSDLGKSNRPQSWYIPGNWEGNQVPGAADDVFIDHGGRTVLSPLPMLPPQVANLAVTHGSILCIDKGKLIVKSGRDEFAKGIVSIGDNKNVAGIEVTGGEPKSLPDLQTTILKVYSLGKLTLLGGRIAINELDINGSDAGNPAGRIDGHGTVEIQSLLDNNGSIYARAQNTGDTLYFKDIANAGLNLSGTKRSGEIIAADGNIHFEAGQIFRFDGKMLIENGRRIVFDNIKRLRVGLNGMIQVAEANSQLVVNGDLVVFGKISIVHQSSLIVSGSVYVGGDESDPTRFVGSGSLGSIEVLEGGTVTVLSNKPVIVYKRGRIIGKEHFNVPVNASSKSPNEGMR